MFGLGFAFCPRVVRTEYGVGTFVNLLINKVMATTQAHKHTHQRESGHATHLAKSSRKGKKQGIYSDSHPPLPFEGILP